jgi:VacB/RNase II family 3'-5' exoribonuclease
MDRNSRVSLSRPSVDLVALARQAMRERGLEPDFPAGALAEASGLPAAAMPPGAADERARLWCSIDNDDSRDLDQLSVAEPAAGGRIRVHVAVADVQAIVARDTAIDRHARFNTTSVYTAAHVFPMLPERLSTDLSSLGADVDRTAFVISFTVAADGTVEAPDVRRAFVRNHAKLAYRGVGTWLENLGPAPGPLAAVSGLDELLRLQDVAAQRLKSRRHEHGALDLETLEARPVLEDGRVVDLRCEPKNRAESLIEDFMIAANGVIARFLADGGFAGLRRVVRSPERWDRLVALARSLGESLPPGPDGPELSRFLTRRRAADPLRFPDQSLSVVKLLGRGEYVRYRPGDAASGHFGLAVREYVHSTAPNRRYPDLVTQRLLAAALDGGAPPYSDTDLDALATHCTEQEEAAERVERQLRKSAAALLLERRIGETFDALVTGASEKGTWVRTLAPTVEGKLMSGTGGLDVGDTLRVRLTSVDVAMGFIDFVRVI